MADRGLTLVVPLILSGCVMRSSVGHIDSDTEATTLDASSGADEGSGTDEGSGSMLPPITPDQWDWQVPEHCRDVAAESAYCLTMAYEGPALIGIDSGHTCVFGSPMGSFLYNPSFAWRGADLITCGADDATQHVARIDLETGQVQTLPHLCVAVTELGDQILVAGGIDGAELRVYDDLAAIGAETPAAALGFGVQGTRMWTDGQLIIDAWHATDTLWRTTMTGEPLANLVLEGYDGWIDGMFVFDGTLLVLTPNNPTGELRRFDPEDGSSRGTLAVEALTVPKGLRCRPGQGG